MSNKPIIQADFVKPNPVPSRKVLQLVFEVSEEEADHAMEVLGGYPQSGQNRWCAIAQLAPAETRTGEPAPVVGPSLIEAAAAMKPPAEQTQERPKGTEGWSQAKRTMVQHSGILRKEKSFHDWIANGWPGIWNHARHHESDPSEIAAYFIRTSCSVNSCRDLDPDRESGRRFREMVSRYEASQRGETEEAMREQIR